MILDIVTRLKQEVGRDVLRAVEGALDLAALDGAPQAPCAWAIPVGDSAKPSGMATIVSQMVTEQFAIVIAVKAPNDKTGAKGVDALGAIRDAVRAALLGWAPPGREPIEYRGGRLIDLKAGTVWWLDQYVTETLIRG